MGQINVTVDGTCSFQAAPWVVILPLKVFEFAVSLRAERFLAPLLRSQRVLALNQFFTSVSTH